MKYTRTPAAALRLGLAFAVAVGLLFMHGLMLPGSSSSGHHPSPGELTTRTPEAAGLVHFELSHESGSMHLVELCILTLATGLGLAAFACAAFGRSVGLRPGVLSTTARVLNVLHGRAPPRTRTHLELAVVLR
jgi:hypothetical protein